MDVIIYYLKNDMCKYLFYSILYGLKIDINSLINNL